MLLQNIINWFQTNVPFEMIDVMSWIVYDKDKPFVFSTALFLGMFIIFYSFYIFTQKAFRLRLIYVILFSLFFYYKSSGFYFLLLIVSSIIDFSLSMVMSREQNRLKRKLYLIIGLVSNLGLLGYFKYTNFLITTSNELIDTNFALHQIFLPVGISFYTFQSISYIIEVYRKEINPTKNYIDYLFFVSFFPQLLAGPIVRAKDFLPQIYQKLNLTKEDLDRGFFLIIGGLIKKTVISDYISVNFVDRVFDAPASYTAFENLMASYGYAIQIYCDFSGYSDMAIGIALLLGFKLPINFNTPYQAASITEFWRRWHISLSTWLKDFLYISVGGNRKGTFVGFFFPIIFFMVLIVWGIYQYTISSIPLIIAIVSLVVFLLTFLMAKHRKRMLFTNVNLMTTMLLGGLWHGPSFRYIIWGALHGMALAVHKIFVAFFPDARRNKHPFVKGIYHIFSVFVTFHFVTFCWIFFRAKDFTTALQMLENIKQLDFNWTHWMVIISGYQNVFLVMLLGYVWHFLPERNTQFRKKIFSQTPLVGKAIVLAFVYWLVFATAGSEIQRFIYYQF